MLIKRLNKDEMNGIERLHIQLRSLTTERKGKSDKMEPILPQLSKCLKFEAVRGGGGGGG